MTVTAIYVETNGTVSIERDSGRTQLPPCPDENCIIDASTNSWVVSAPLAWKNVRTKRDTLLRDCDWTMLSDAPLTGEQAAAWATYRQALRDVTDQPDPCNITWPTPP